MSTYPYTKRRNDRNQSAERLVKIRKLRPVRNLSLVTGWLFLEDGFIYFLKKSPTGGTWQSENIRPLETAVPIRRSKNLLRKCDDQVPKWTHRGGWQRVEPFSVPTTFERVTTPEMKMHRVISSLEEQTERLLGPKAIIVEGVVSPLAVRQPASVTVRSAEDDNSSKIAGRNRSTVKMSWET